MKKRPHIHAFTKIDLLLHASSFFISMLGMLLIFKSRGFYPFKDNTPFVMDMHSQFMEFFASLRYTLGGDDSLFFSWSMSLGGNYLGLYAYYLANPLSWITVLFPLEKLYIGILILTLIKIACCGLTFSLFASFLWKRSHRVDASPASCWRQFILLPLAVSYALISYNMAYSFCLMWTDGVILLPLVLLGVERLLEGRNGLLFLLSLTASFVFNYYTGYMVGLFTGLYLGFRLFVMVRKENLRFYSGVVLRFAATTLLSIGLSAPLLLPAIKSIGSGKMSLARDGLDTVTNFPFLSLLDMFRNGSYHSVNWLGMPYIYCGCLALVLSVAFFLSRRISLREKIAAGAVLAFLILSFYLTGLDFAWHGFLKPNWFPYRYSFVFSFFLLYLSARVLCSPSLDKLPSLWQRKPVFEAVAALLLGIVALDMGLNGRAILYGLADEFNYDSIDYYTDYLESIRPLTESIAAWDQGLYRMNQDYAYEKNDGMLLGFHGMAHFSSIFNQSVNSLTAQLGLAQESVWNTGYGSTPLTDSLLGVKYVLRSAPAPAFYTKLEDTVHHTSSYENPNALAFVYSAPLSDAQPVFSDGHPFANQSALLNSIASTDLEFFAPVEHVAEGSDTGWRYTFVADSSDPVYLYIHAEGFTLADVLVNGKEAGHYFTSETKCILYLGSFSAGEQVLVEVIPVTAIHVDFAEICHLRTDALKATLASLQANGMEITSHKGGRIIGTIDVPEGNRIVTSIPYDQGWTVKLDEKKVPYERFLDTFITLETEGGEHSIEFSYRSPGFVTGIFVFLLALLSTVLYFRFSPAGRSSCPKRDSNP